MQRLTEVAPGVLVATAEYATTSTTVITTADGGCLVIDPAVTVADLSAQAPGHDLALFADLVALPGGATHIPWDGPSAQVIVHDGHAPGHAAVFLPDSGVLVAGDMLSDIEIPLLDTAARDPLGDYRAGLRRLVEVPGVRWLVPGHGHVTGAAGFRRRAGADTGYLDRLAAGQQFTDPRAAAGWQRDWHDQQLRKVARSS